MKLVIVSPTRTLCSTETDEVTFPGSAGRFTVLTGHAPLLSSLSAGEITYTSGKGRTVIAVKSGVVRVKDDNIEACVVTAEGDKE